MLSGYLSRARAAITGGFTRAFGQGEAAAQADPADQMQVRQAKMEQLSARLPAFASMLVRHGRMVTVSGNGTDRYPLFRAVPDFTTRINLHGAVSVKGQTGVIVKGNAARNI